MPHINYGLDFTSEVFVVNRRRVLLRKHDKHKIWLSVGGHVEPGEDPVEAAVREVREEVGLDVEIIPTSEILDTEREKYGHLIAPVFVNRHFVKDEHEHVTFVYFAESSSDEILEGDGEKSEDCRWFSAEELEGLKEGIGETVKEYARRALKFFDENGLNGDKI